MASDKDIKYLCDDGFEGSTNEHRIFREVFFGNDQGKTSKKCLVTGAINFQRNNSKTTDLLISQNSENSAISNLQNVSNDDDVSNGKRIKLNPDEQPVLNSVTCRLVESTSEGITSISYLLKGDVHMHSLPSFNEDAEKEYFALKAIASPVSQEGFVNKSQALITHRKRTVKSDVDKMSSCVDNSKSPRTVLRKYIQDLLKAAGWEITIRRKKDNANWGFIYLLPHTRRSLRDFRKVWNLCGYNLSIDTIQLQLDDGKQFKDMSSFWSDLYLTLCEIEKEPSLAQQWCLLDPFVNLVFIEKTINHLRAGEVVEAKSSLLIDIHTNLGPVMSSKKRGRIGNKKSSPDGLCESSLVGVSELTNIEEKNAVNMNSCGTRITVDFGKSSRGTVRALNGVPVTGTINGLNINAVQANDVDGNSDHSSSCINEFPIAQNGLVVLSDFVSSPQDGTPKSPVSCRYLSYLDEETASEVDKTLQTGTSGRVLDANFFEENINPKTQVQIANVEKGSVIRKKSSRSVAKKSTTKTKMYKCKPLKKRKTQKGSCRLLARRENHNEKKWFIVGPRTVLSWLISYDIISIKEVIQYRNSKDNSLVKEGLITKDGILCKCCNVVFSLSGFKSHAGYKLNRPCLNLVMGSGKSFTLCQLEAWLNEYKKRKSATRPVKVENMDQNDDTCGLCGDGGELICCDNCPSTFHQKCLSEQELPEGDWYCQQCICRICGNLVVNEEAVVSAGALKCSQCDHRYHEACLKENGACHDVATETWFCGESCQEVYSGLKSKVGALNCLSDGYTWTLLRCIHGDQKVNPVKKFVALKAEWNSKLAVALTIMEECFLSVVDTRTGIDMIPHILYNWRSEFARLDYNGFYAMVLEKDDMLISVASIRIHGVTVAEMPLIATCSKYRRQGMCRRLMSSIEEMLRSFKVETLVITAIPDLVETWTVGFGFEPLQDDERRSFSHVNLMVFPGTVWLKKTMYKKQTTDEQTSSDHAAPFCKEDHKETNLYSGGMLTVKIENRHTNLGVGSLHEDFSKMSCDKSALSEMVIEGDPIAIGESILLQSDNTLLTETASNVDSVVMVDERELLRRPYKDQSFLDQGECQVP